MDPQRIAAILFLVLVPCALLGWLAYGVYRSKLRPDQYFFWCVAYLIARFLWRAKLPNGLPIPDDRGVVIVCNHRSSVDPFFIQTATFRKVHSMVAREYFSAKAFGWFLRLCEAIPVGRGGVDTAATKQAIRYAAAGGVVCMFPEGRINMTEKLMLPGRPGAAMIALKARALVLPCYIEGSPYNNSAASPFFMRARVKVRFGEPIDLSEYYDREQEDGITREVMLRCLKAVAALADQPDYEPELAGRQWKPTEEQMAADRAEQLRREGRTK